VGLAYIALVSPHVEVVSVLSERGRRVSTCVKAPINEHLKELACIALASPHVEVVSVIFKKAPKGVCVKHLDWWGIAPGEFVVMTGFDTGSPVACVIALGVVMTVGTCGVEQDPLGVSLSRA
jgi:hypothetical protein